MKLEELYELCKTSRKKTKSIKEEDKDITSDSDKIDSTYDEENDEEINEAKLDNWKPHEIKGLPLPEFNIPVKKSRNFEMYKREQFSKILTFIEYTKRKRIGNGCTALPIPTTSSVNLMIWGYPMAVSRAIKLMEEIGLIKIFSDTYRWGVPYKGGNYGKTYAYFKENEDKFIQYCQENNISKFQTKNVEEIKDEKQIKKIVYVDETKKFDVSEVRFGKGLKLEKPNGVSKTDFMAYLTQCLYINYPEFLFHQMKVDEINEKCYGENKAFALRFKPHYKFNKDKVVRIGIRLTNEYCNKPREERKEIREQYGFRLEKDIKSSVPRLTLSINKGHWIEEDIDIYERINEKFDPGSEFSNARREAIKHFILRTYFDEGSDKWLGKNVTLGIDNTKYEKKNVDELMGTLRRATKEVVGGRTFGSDIFYVESCVYLMTLYDLLMSGHKVWLVYDCFYSNGEEDQETFSEMIINSVRMNFKWFLEKSNYKEYIEGAVNEEEKSGLLMKDVIKNLCEKYGIDIKIKD